MDYKFIPTEYFLKKGASAIADFEYEVAFTSEFNSKFLGEKDKKIVSNSSADFFSASSGSFPEKINFSTQISDIHASASTETQEIDFPDLNLSGGLTDGLFLYYGTQVAFFAEIDPPAELESLDVEILSLQFCPTKEFVEQSFQQQLFNTMANSYYLGYSSGPVELSDGSWATDVDFLEGEITQQTAPQRTNFARSHMSTADFIWDESIPSLLASFPDVVHFWGDADEAIAAAFVLEKPRYPERAEEKGNVIFAAPLAEGELKKGAQYSGSITLATEWMIIL